MYVGLEKLKRPKSLPESDYQSTRNTDSLMLGTVERPKSLPNSDYRSTHNIDSVMFGGAFHRHVAQLRAPTLRVVKRCLHLVRLRFHVSPNSGVHWGRSFTTSDRPAANFGPIMLESA